MHADVLLDRLSLYSLPHLAPPSPPPSHTMPGSEASTEARKSKWQVSRCTWKEAHLLLSGSVLRGNWERTANQSCQVMRIDVGWVNTVVQLSCRSRSFPIRQVLVAEAVFLPQDAQRFSLHDNADSASCRKHGARSLCTLLGSHNLN